MERKFPKRREKNLFREIKRILVMNEAYISGRVNEILYEVKKAQNSCHSSKKIA